MPCLVHYCEPTQPTSSALIVVEMEMSTVQGTYMKPATSHGKQQRGLFYTPVERNFGWLPYQRHKPVSDQKRKESSYNFSNPVILIVKVYVLYMSQKSPILNHPLHIPNPCQIPSLHPLNSQRRNQRRPNTTPILCRENTNRVRHSIFPI